MTQITLSPFTNFSSAVPWGLWVAVYIWLVGISAGCFFFAMRGHLQDIPPLKRLTRLGLALALATLVAGLLSIQIDLGRIERFHKLFTSPSFSSAMAWMVWLYTVYFVILVSFLMRLKHGKGISRPVAGCGLLLALALIVVESLLFSLPPGKHWHSAVFSAHFLTSSLVSAVAAMMLAVGIFWRKDAKGELLAGLAKTAIPWVVLNMLVEALDAFVFKGMSHKAGLILLSGNILMLALLLRHAPWAVTLAGVIGLINVLASKYGVLISAQTIEPFRGFGAAYIEPRLRFAYAPTSFESSMALFLAGLAVVVFYFLYRILPLTREE